MKTDPKFAPARLDACSETLPGQVPDEGACIPPESLGQSERQGAGPQEIGGRKGMDPTRYGDWEKDGRCIDF